MMQWKKLKHIQPLSLTEHAGQVLRTYNNLQNGNELVEKYRNVIYNHDNLLAEDKMTSKIAQFRHRIERPTVLEVISSNKIIR